jgi:hypothetical protein
LGGVYDFFYRDKEVVGVFGTFSCAASLETEQFEDGTFALPSRRRFNSIASLF